VVGVPQRPSRRLALAGISLLTGAAAVSGCGPIRSGAAAVVGDTRISTDQVTRSADELTREADQVNRSGAIEASLTYLVQTRVMTDIAQRQQPPITVTDADVAQLRQRLLAQVGGADALNAAFLQERVPSNEQDAYLRLLLLRQKVGQRIDPAGAADGSNQAAVDKLVAQASKRLHVAVNPRFGRWDASKGLVEQVSSGGLATGPSPSPSTLGLG
jgi:hypothetical protein